MDTYDVHQLSLGETLGEGGQATVHALADGSGLAFKRYLNPASAQLLEPMITELATVGADVSLNGRPVHEWAAWPTARVVENGRFIGFLMPTAPARFGLHVGGKRRLADLSYISCEPRPMWGQVTLPSAAVRLELLSHLCGAVQALHDRGLVVGDISFGNALWTVQPQPAIMLLDCDGITRESAPVSHPAYDTMDWDDPQAQPRSAADRDRDRYKLALAVLRILTRSLSLRPEQYAGEQLFVPEGFATDRLISLIGRAAGAAGTRPTAAEWRSALSKRETIGVTPPTPIHPVAPPPKPGILVTGSPGPRRRQPVRQPVGP